MIAAATPFSLMPASCDCPRRDADSLVPHYLGRGGPPRGVSALLDLRRWPSLEAYERDVLRQKGVASDVSRAARRGYWIQEFAWRRWLEDVVAINRSAPVRQGRAMGPSYRRSIEEMGGVDRAAVVTPPACRQHWRQTWGVFGRPHGEAHGPVLVAYCSLVRTEALAIYSMWLGHAAHLRDGVMHALHFGLVAHLMGGGACAGVEAVLYGGWNDGGPGLQAWKRRLGFAPAALFEVPR